MDIIRNEICASNGTINVVVDAIGGAILDFHLKAKPLNTLSFRLPNKDLPQKGGFQGHFLCLGRWGDPSDGEAKCGIPKHGETCRIPWETSISKDGLNLHMGTESKQDELGITRKIQLHPEQPIVKIEETITNKLGFGRFYQMVQHPTFASPFLDNKVRLFSNASKGFNQSMCHVATEKNSAWPMGMMEDGGLVNLVNFDRPYNSVFSYIVDPQGDLGWTVVYNAKEKLLIGYIWSREQYPWINIWQEWAEGQLQYLGVEFGTTGLHQPIQLSLQRQQLMLFDQPTYAFIDGIESKTYAYHMFLLQVDTPFERLESIKLVDGKLLIQMDDRTFTLDAT